MAQAKSGSSASKKASSRSSNGGSAQKRAKPSSSRSKASKSRAKSNNGSRAASSAKGTAAQQDRGAVGTVASEIGDAVKQPFAKVKGPALTGVATAAGLIGGAVLGARVAGKPKKVLGVPVPGTGNGLGRQVGKAAKRVGKAGKQAGKAGKQLGEFTDEIRTARRKAEELGKAVN
jgi:hypothetical protein